MMPSPGHSHGRTVHIDKLDFDANRRPTSINSGSVGSNPHGLLRDDESLLSDVVDGIIEKDRQNMQRLMTKYLSFASAILSW